MNTETKIVRIPRSQLTEWAEKEYAQKLMLEGWTVELEYTDPNDHTYEKIVLERPRPNKPKDEI
jgi:hypothetical protein